MSEPTLPDDHRPATLPADYPDGWDGHLDALVGKTELLVAGFEIEIKITADPLRRVYFPLLALLQRQAQEREERILAGLAGLPGGGKSTFAAAVEYVARAVLPADCFQVIGMDGWHYPNNILNQRTTTDPEGNIVPLMQRKGGPESFDVSALAASLDRLKADRQTLSLPVYDRRLHEPRPDGMTVLPETRILLIEGNYLLLDTPPWDQLYRRLSPRLFLAGNVQQANERLIARHMRGGLSRAEAELKNRRNDRLNIELVSTTQSQADYLLHL